MSIKTIQPSEGWVRLVADVNDKTARTVQCRGEDPVEVAVFKDSYTPTENDAGTIIYPKRYISDKYTKTEDDSIRAVPAGGESIHARAYLNKEAELGVML